ncbi:hypothetical protein JQC67_15910 [Aurantibacter crassamenti]|uniref:hypothetical protein n=1 Tax=Aurantibacter crassamenti TaxID=1837375 RepID=UPI001939E7F7|nr:hypothetical protein [Aurantibacter crassamenti]MBM1107642.1 hypothetical protein [Aurantibacter crassamenti]
MIKYAITILFSMGMLFTQDALNQKPADEVRVGDVFKIGSPQTQTFKHINFPRANFIIKRGGIANYKSVTGNLVEVTAIKEKKDGTTEVTLKRKDGSRFFGSHTAVEADIYEAVNSGELHAK